MASCECGDPLVPQEGYQDATVYVCPTCGTVDEAPLEIALLSFKYVRDHLPGERYAGGSYEEVALEGEGAYPPDLPKPAIRLYLVYIDHTNPTTPSHKGSSTVYVAEHADGWVLYDEDFPTCNACNECSYVKDGKRYCRDCGELDEDGDPVSEPAGVEA